MNRIRNQSSRAWLAPTVYRIAGRRGSCLRLPLADDPDKRVKRVKRVKSADVRRALPEA
jgi:hypothetical protein